MSTISPICGGWVSACLICESPWNCERFLWRTHVAWHRAVVFPRHLPIFNFGVDLGPTSQNWMLVLDQICLQRLKGKMCLSKCLLEVFLTSLIILSHIPPHQGPWKAICSGCLVQREFCGFSSLRIHFAVVVNADVLSGNIRCGLILRVMNTFTFLWNSSAVWVFVTSRSTTLTTVHVNIKTYSLPSSILLAYA